MQFPDPSASYDFGGSISHSYHNIYPSSLTRYSATRFQDYNDATFPKAPIIGNVTTHAATPHPVSSVSTPKVHIAKAETPPLSANVSSELFQSMESDINNYITKRKGPSSFLQYKLSWEEFLEFREQAKNSVPGWEKLKYVIALIEFPHDCIDLKPVWITKRI